MLLVLLGNHVSEVMAERYPIGLCQVLPVSSCNIKELLVYVLCWRGAITSYVCAGCVCYSVKLVMAQRCGVALQLTRYGLWLLWC